jgi:hypothetical protein
VSFLRDVLDHLGGQARRDYRNLDRYRRAVAEADTWFDFVNVADEATTDAKDHFLNGAAAYRARLHRVLDGAS